MCLGWNGKIVDDTNYIFQLTRFLRCIISMLAIILNEIFL
jgi:hypothetical protein